MGFPVITINNTLHKFLKRATTTSTLSRTTRDAYRCVVTRQLTGNTTQTGFYCTGAGGDNKKAPPHPKKVPPHPKKVPPHSNNPLKTLIFFVHGRAFSDFVYAFFVHG